MTLVLGIRRVGELLPEHVVGVDRERASGASGWRRSRSPVDSGYFARVQRAAPAHPHRHRVPCRPIACLHRVGDHRGGALSLQSISRERRPSRDLSKASRARPDLPLPAPPDWPGTPPPRRFRRAGSSPMRCPRRPGPAFSHLVHHALDHVYGPRSARRRLDAMRRKPVQGDPGDRVHHGRVAGDRNHVASRLDCLLLRLLVDVLPEGGTFLPLPGAATGPPGSAVSPPSRRAVSSRVGPPGALDGTSS